MCALCTTGVKYWSYTITTLLELKPSGKDYWILIITILTRKVLFRHIMFDLSQGLSINVTPQHHHHQETPGKVLEAVLASRWQGHIQRPSACDWGAAVHSTRQVSLLQQIEIQLKHQQGQSWKPWSELPGNGEAIQSFLHNKIVTPLEDFHKMEIKTWLGCYNWP